MSDIELFTYRDTEVRTVLRDGEPWFVAADVCDILGYSHTPSAIRRLDSDEYTQVEFSQVTPNVRTPDGPPPRPLTVVNEPGLYSLILWSHKPEAKQFRRWVTHDLLPQIRRTGRYEAKPALPQTYVEALRELASSVEERERLAEQVAELAPAAHSWNVLADASGDYDLRNAAQILSRDRAIKIGQNQLADLLRELRWVDTRNRRPYQAQINIGRLAVRIRTWEDPETGEPRNSYQPRITPKGLEFLHRHLGGVEPLGPGQQLVLVDPAS